MNSDAVWQTRSVRVGVLPVGVEGGVDAAADRLALAAVEARLVAPVRTIIVGTLGSRLQQRRFRR